MPLQLIFRSVRPAIIIVPVTGSLIVATRTVPKREAALVLAVHRDVHTAPVLTLVEDGAYIVMVPGVRVIV